MRRILNAFKQHMKHDPFHDSIISIVEAQDFSRIKKIAENAYSIGDSAVTVKYFDPECYEEMQISFGYSLGKGFSVVIRHYGEHLIVINHEILEQFLTYEFTLSPASYRDREYRLRLDTVATNIMNAVEAINMQGSLS